MRSQTLDKGSFVILRSYWSHMAPPGSFLGLPGASWALLAGRVGYRKEAPWRPLIFESILSALIGPPKGILETYGTSSRVPWGFPWASCGADGLWKISSLATLEFLCIFWDLVRPHLLGGSWGSPGGLAMESKTLGDPLFSKASSRSLHGQILAQATARAQFPDGAQVPIHAHCFLSRRALVTNTYAAHLHIA